MEGREGQIQEAGVMAGLYMQSWKNHFTRIRQPLPEPSCVVDAQAEILGLGSGGAGEGNNAPISFANVGDGAAAVPSSV